MTGLRLPDELLILIFRHATNVPEALDTSYEFIAQEDRDKVLRLMDDSMRTKLVLSVVSKHFHALTDDLLYELIIVQSFNHVPHLARLLRSSLAPYAPFPRGHLCRRLDFYLGCTHCFLHEWDDAWDVGVHVLWGVLPPCAQLEVLIFHADATCGQHCCAYAFLAELPECTTRAGLWKTLSGTCGRTLRRLEVLGIAIRMDRLELMLRYMPHVEVCTVGDNVEFVDAWASELQRATGERGSEAVDVYDEDPPQDPDWEPPRYRYQCRDPPPEVATWFGEETLAEFHDTRTSAVWPPYTGDGPPYLLPKLHTLFLAQLNERIFEFRLPALRTLATAALHVYWRVFLHTSLTRESKTTDEDSPSHPGPGGRQHHREGWYTIDIDIATEETAPYFLNPVPHSTPFGLFPASLTQLYIPRKVSLSRILYFFPNLRHLTWVAYVRCAPEEPENANENEDGVPRLPFYEHNHVLREVSFFEYCHAYGMCRSALCELVDAVEAGWVVRLERVHLIDDPFPNYDELRDMSDAEAVEDLDFAREFLREMGVEMGTGRALNPSLMVTVAPQLYC
ncbi:hypothetical protein H0H92_013987 [Tricholoma furcatifolium]|nr:hypothetical protein H0H92_013987 [Tricholoma furcatifolium]